MAKNSRNAYGFGLSGPEPALAPTPIIANRLPTANDTAFELGSLWINPNTGQAWTLTAVAAGAATWALSSPGASDVDTINGLSPVAGNIIIDGGTNVTDVNAGNTVTLNLDPAITLATSVTSPIYASAAAMDINVAAGSNVTIQLGDAAGANILEIENSASAAIATIDSLGIATFAGMDGVLGGVAPAAVTGTLVTANTGFVGPYLIAPAATDTLIDSVAGQDMILRLGDAAGGNFLRVQSSTPADIFTIDSLGVFSVLAGLTIAGAFAQTAGTFNVGQDNAANAINIGGGTTARAIGIANSAAAHTLTIGNAACGAFTIDTGAGISIDSALASNFTVTGAGADLDMGSVGGSVDLTASEAAADAIDIQATDAAGGINVDCGTAGFDLLATGGGFSIDGQAASNLTVTSAGLDLSVQGVGCAVNITSTEAENDAIYIDATAANGGILIQAGTGGIRIGDEVDTTGITMGNIAPTANRNITIGSGTVVTAAVTDDISIGDGGATTNANSIKHVDINNGGVTLGEVNTYIACGAITSGTHLTEIQTGNAAAGTVTLNMSTGTGTKIVNVGNADANTTVNIDAITLINDDVNAAFSACTGTSTGAITLGAIANSGAVAIESSTTVDVDAAGAISLNSTGAALNIGDDADAFAINIGTGAAARNIAIGNATGATAITVDCGTGAAQFATSATVHATTIGSVTGASATTIQAGTGEITVTGTVKQIDCELMGQDGIYIPRINQDSIAATAANTGGVPTGNTGDINLITMQTGAVIQAFVIGAGQTILQPIMGAAGLIMNGDQVIAEGYEYNFPYHQYTIGTSAAFFFELGLYINDMDGAAPYVFGFRKTEANNAVMANYDTYATIGMNAATSILNVVILDELNGLGQTATNTNDAWGGDTAYNVLAVWIDATGNVTYTINGAAPTATHALQFDNGDVVIPFIRIEHSASATDVCIRRMRIGYQP